MFFYDLGQKLNFEKKSLKFYPQNAKTVFLKIQNLIKCFEFFQKKRK